MKPNALGHADLTRHTMEVVLNVWKAAQRIRNQQLSTIIVDLDILNEPDCGGRWNKSFRVDHELDEVPGDDSVNMGSEVASTNCSGIDERHSCAASACDGAIVILVIIQNCEFSIVLVLRRSIILYLSGRPRP